MSTEPSYAPEVALQAPPGRHHLMWADALTMCGSSQDERARDRLPKKRLSRKTPLTLSPQLLQQSMPYVSTPWGGDGGRPRLRLEPHMGKWNWCTWPPGRLQRSGILGPPGLMIYHHTLNWCREPPADPSKTDDAAQPGALKDGLMLWQPSNDNH